MNNKDNRFALLTITTTRINYGDLLRELLSFSLKLNVFITIKRIKITTLILLMTLKSLMMTITTITTMMIKEILMNLAINIMISTRIK